MPVLTRPVAGNCDAQHPSQVAVVVVDRVVLRRAIVPERQRPGRPAKAAGEFGLDLLAKSVSPPAGGTSSANSIDPIGGSSRYVVSECQTPPKFVRSCGSFVTSMISGYSASPSTNG